MEQKGNDEPQCSPWHPVNNATNSWKKKGGNKKKVVCVGERAQV